MNTLVVLGTTRDNSNTHKSLTDNLPFKDFELVELHKLKVLPYAYGSKTSDDDFLGVINQMVGAHTIVFATPVYWYAMSGVMKVFFDRFTELITTAKPLGRALKGKTVYLLSTGSDESLPDGFEVPFRRTCEYFGMKFEGSIYVSIKD